MTEARWGIASPITMDGYGPRYEGDGGALEQAP